MAQLLQRGQLSETTRRTKISSHGYKFPALCTLNAMQCAKKSMLLLRRAEVLSFFFFEVTRNFGRCVSVSNCRFWLHPIMALSALHRGNEARCSSFIIREACKASKQHSEGKKNTNTLNAHTVILPFYTQKQEMSLIVDHHLVT